jgi:hypothetical protein
MIAAGTAAPAQADEGGSGHYLPGFGGFFGGILPSERGTYFANIQIQYTASAGAAQALPIGGVARFGVQAYSFGELPSFTYVTGKKVLGGTFAVNLSPSLVYGDATAAVAAGPGLAVVKDQNFNLGDTYFAPVMLGWNRGNLHYTATMGIFAPTGDWAKGQLVPTGKNFWTIEPLVGTTYLNPKSGWEFSALTGIDFNTTNPGTDYKSGDDFHVDFLVANHVIRAIDVTPTLLEVVGISHPASVNGVPQRPIEGVSMAYTFAKENAGAPSRRKQQYFEMFGNRALYREGWMACCRHGRLPWETSGSVTWDNDDWELYHIAEDFSQAADLADQQSKKLRELQDLFMADAAKYNVLPLDDRFAERFDVTLRPSFFAGRKQVTFYPGMVRLPEGSAPKTTGVRHTITAAVEIPKEGAEGVIACLGGDAAGWSLFLWEGKPRYHYNFFGLKRTDVISPQPLPAGRHTIKVEFTPDSPKPGCPARVRLFVDGQAVADGRIDEQVPQRCGTETMDVGMDCVSPVCADYEKRGLFPFTGRIVHVTFDFDGAAPQPTGHERLELSVKMD